MPRIRELKAGSPAFDEFLTVLEARGSGAVGSVQETVRDVVESVRRDGDEAVRRLTARFDHLKVRNLRIPPSMVREAWKASRKAVVRSLETAVGRLTAFHERQRESSWFFDDRDAMLGQLVRPLHTVGVYVPGGKASYPSSVLMNVIPARVAGVERIVMCVPTPRGEVNPYVLVAADMLGVRDIYRVGGAQAVAAMAYGTSSIPRVDKIVGPGNIYVATAKRMVFGQVDIDMIAGPSEILVVADGSADPSCVAADLLGQAEHDELASAILVTPAPGLASVVMRELDRQLRKLERRKIAAKALENYGAVVMASDLQQAVEVANRIAPEHLEVITENPNQLLPAIRNAGAVFVGPWTPEALGDYVAGPNHTLPTGGTARFFSPLGTYDFVKRSSLLSFSRETFQSLADDVLTLAGVEGLEAHAKSVQARLRLARKETGK